MFYSCSDAAKQLGVTERQVQRAVSSGQLEAQRVGGRFIIHERSLHAFQQTVRRGRRWSEGSIADAFKLLSGQSTTATGSARSRLKTRVRLLQAEDLAGILLQDKRISIHRASHEQAALISSEVEVSAGLGGGGLRVIAAREARKDALKRRLPLDIGGNVVAVSSDHGYAKAVEAAALIVYGSVRERSAGVQALTELQESV